LADPITFPLPMLDGWDMAVVGPSTVDDDQATRPAWTQWRLIDRQRLALSAGNITPEAPEAWQTRCRLEGAIHATLLQGMDLDATSERLQHLLAQLTTGADAAHLFCGIVDLEEGQLRFQSMGSLAGYLVRPHGWEPLVETSPPLDGCQLHVYPTVWQHLDAGDALLLCHLPPGAAPDSSHALAEYVLHHSHLAAAELATGIGQLAPEGCSGLLLMRREG
jgi:hypothetical protein